MQNKLGISIPTYNRAEILKSNLLAILDELIEFQIPVYISDDSSNDETKIAIDDLRAKYPLFHYYKNSPGLGHDKNCLYTLSLPTTDYVWYLGDSMVIKKRSIARIVDIIDTNDVDFICINAEGRKLDIPSKIYTEKESTFNDIGWHLTMTGATIYRRSAIDTESIDLSKCKNFPQLAMVFRNFDHKKLYWSNEKLIFSNANKKSYWNNNVLNVFFGDYSNTVQYIFREKDENEVSYLVYQHANRSGLLGTSSLLNLVSTGNLDRSSFNKYRSLFKNFNTLEKVTSTVFLNSPIDLVKIIYKILKK